MELDKKVDESSVPSTMYAFMNIRENSYLHGNSLGRDIRQTLDKFRENWMLVNSRESLPGYSVLIFYDFVVLDVF